MCGIAGIIHKTKSCRLNPQDCVNAFIKSMNHRGPNGNGAHVRSDRAFLNLRLAIVDIAGGDQPIYTADNKTGIVFNGEIYNYKNIRKNLEAVGIQFKTNSDTEVILQAFVSLGTKSFDKLNGMFGTCLWDENTDTVYLVRDRFGIKPLYIYEDSDVLIFSSELKGILALKGMGLDFSLNSAGIQDYLMFRYTQAPFTIFNKIRRLDPGTYLKIQNGQATQFRFTELEYQDTYPIPSKEAALMELENLMLKSVESQLMGEVPIGVLLSGGLDSSAIAYYVHKLGANLKTFNIGFPELNEFEYSHAVAKQYGLDHIEIVMTVDELASNLDKVIAAIDEPIADPACFPLYRLSEELKQHVTVVLSGEGGDELFAGYPQYSAIRERARNNPDSSPADFFSAFLERSWYFLDHQKYLINKNLPPHHLRFQKYFHENTLLNGMLNYDMRTWMPENLMMKADKIMMAHSLEGRFPFLDIELFNFSARLPETFKLKQGGNEHTSSKWLLRELMTPKLPESVITRPKMGFSVPVEELLLRFEEQVRQSVHSAENTSLAGVVDISAIQDSVDSFYKTRQPIALQIWTLFILCRWSGQNL